MRTIAVGSVALVAIVGVTVVAFGAGWSALSVIGSILLRVAIVSLPLGVLAQALVRSRPLPFWVAGLLGPAQLLTQTLLLHNPRLPLDAVASAVWVGAALLAASLVDVGAKLFRVWSTRRAVDRSESYLSR